MISVEKADSRPLLVALYGTARYEDRNLSPILQSSDRPAVSINSIFTAQTLVITLWAQGVTAGKPAASQPQDEESCISILYRSEIVNAEFDNEVAMISGKEPDRSCDTMPRYYKDTWSPDRGGAGVKKSAGSVVGLEKLVRGFQLAFSKIALRGIAVQQAPAAACAIPLLNLRPSLQRNGQRELLAEVEYMIALALINGKRFVQASEILRKLQRQILTARADSDQSKAMHNKAAKMEILIADGMSPHFQLFEKLHALQRAVELALGTAVLPITGIAPSEKYSSEDIYTFLTRMHPNLIRLLLGMLGGRAESQRMATIRCMDFVIGHMGCSLGAYASHILRALLLTYPATGNNTNSNVQPADSLNMSVFSVSSGTESSPKPLLPTHPKLSEPATSAPVVIVTQNTDRLAALYTHLLETFLSVLSSISSQILHKLFYEIVLPNTYSPELSTEVRHVLLTVADKIVSICQGDLVPTSAFLNGVVKDQGSSNKKIAAAATSLWQTIRAKLCPNCATKARKRLVCWVGENLTSLAQRISSHPGSRETAEEDAALRVGTYIDIACVLTSSGQNEGEPNPLVLPAPEERTDFYELLNPLLYWLNFSMASEGRMELFKQVWQCTANILSSMRATIGFDVNSFIMPLIATVNDHCKMSSPTVPMLRFLDTVLKEFTSDYGEDMQHLLIELTSNVTQRIPNFPYDEIFSTLDLLLDMIFPALPDTAFVEIVAGLNDRYTARTKRQQESVQKFVAMTMARSLSSLRERSGRNFFLLALHECMLRNRDVDLGALQKQKDAKKAVRVHESFVQKLGFAVELLKALGAEHRELFELVITNPETTSSLNEMLGNGHSSVRLRAYEIVDILCTYYAAHAANAKSRRDDRARELSRELLLSQLTLRSPEIVRREQLLLARLVLTVTKRSLGAPSDSYMQFNSLILLDTAFQRLLPVPSFSQELLHRKQRLTNPSAGGKVGKADVIDLETVEPEKLGEYPASDGRYLHTRLMTALKVWQYVRQALNSPWSNIRSIAYGLVCSMFKVTVQDYRGSFRDRLKTAILPVLVSLLGSKESEAKAGGLNILGSFCGLGYDVGDNENLKDQFDFFRRNSDFVSLAIWQQVFDLQDDWDSTIKEAATVLVQFSAPKESVTHFTRVRAESRKLRLRCLAGKFGPVCMSAAAKLLTLNKVKDDSNSVAELLDMMGRTSDLLSNNDMAGAEEGTAQQPQEFPDPEAPIGKATDFDDSAENSSFADQTEEKEEAEDKEIFFVTKYTSAQIKDIISIFRNDFRPPKNLWIESHLADPTPADEAEGLGDLLPAEPQPEAPAAIGGKDKVPAGELPLADPVPRHRIVDVLEDKLVDSLSQPPKPAMPSERVVEKKEEKKEEEKEEEKKMEQPVEQTGERAKEKAAPVDSIDAEPYKFLPPEDEDLKQEDLGVIEVEGDEEDFLGPLEESKVPVLKNSYADVNNKRPRAPKPASKSSSASARPDTRVPIDPLSGEDPKASATEEVKEEMPAEKAAKEEDSPEREAPAELTLIEPPPLPVSTALSQPPVKINEKNDDGENHRNEEEEAPVMRSNPSSAEKRGKKKKDGKYNQSFNGTAGPTKKPKKTRANKSFEHTAYHTTRSAAPSASRSCLKNLQISSPSDTLRFYATLLSPHLPRSCRGLHRSLAYVGTNRRKKVMSTRTKPTTAAAETEGHKGGGHARHASSHSSSLPSTPRTQSAIRGKKKVSPEKFLNTVHFNPKHKHGGSGRGCKRENFAQTSPALAAILKSLAIPTATSGRTRHAAEEGKKSEERPRRARKASKGSAKVRLRKDAPQTIQEARQSYIPVQTINIRTDQINFRTVDEERHITPMRDNFVQEEGGHKRLGEAEDDEIVNQTY